MQNTPMQNLALRLVWLTLPCCFADDQSDAVCLREWDRLIPVVRQFRFTSPHNFEEADDAVSVCEDVFMTSWSIASSFLLCAPKECLPRMVSEVLALDAVQRWLFTSPQPEGISDILAGLGNRGVAAVASTFSEQPLPPIVQRMTSSRGFDLDFVLAGFSHSGTTTLHRALIDHPAVSMHSTDSIGGGELHEFFWFSSFTSDIVAETLGSLLTNTTRGARATWASTEEQVMRRLSKIPGLKVIVVLRDPVAQLDSMLSHGFSFFSPFGQETGLAILHTGTIFARHVLAFWPRSRVLPVPFVQLKMAPNATMDRVFRFLGLSAGITGRGGSRRHWLHRRPARLPIPKSQWRQGLCDIPAEWRPSVGQGDLDLGLPLRSLIRARFAPERRLIDAFLGDFGWPEPRLDVHSCPDDTSMPVSDHEYVPGAHDLCAAGAALVAMGRLRPECAASDFCPRCCAFLQARCDFFWECCFPMQEAVRTAGLPALREALCGTPHGGGCCFGVGSLQSP